MDHLAPLTFHVDAHYEPPRTSPGRRNWTIRRATNDPWTIASLRAALAAMSEAGAPDRARVDVLTGVLYVSLEEPTPSAPE